MRTVAFSNDGRLIAAAGRSGVVRVWDATTGMLQSDASVHEQRIRQLIFTDDQQLITCGEDGFVKIAPVGKLEQARTLPKHGGKLFSLCLLNDGLLATGGSDNVIYLWNLQELTQVGTLQGHTGTVTSLDFDGNMMVSGSYDTYFRLWTTEKVASTPLLRR